MGEGDSLDEGRKLRALLRRRGQVPRGGRSSLRPALAALLLGIIAILLAGSDLRGPGQPQASFASATSG